MKKNPNLLRIGILGYGEVGQAIASFYTVPVLIRDLDRNDWETLRGQVFDVLHVCIPYSGTFVAEVGETILAAAPQAVVFIHSTVPPGTTEKLRAVLGQDGIGIVHAPVRGRHPDLAEGIRTFPMYVGADSPTCAEYAAVHLTSIGITPSVLFKSRSSELLKLLDTTYYGLCIAFHAYAADLCEKEGVNFDMVMTDANISYKQGYEALGIGNVARPVLAPPKAGRIGGHCVIPNAKLLKEQYGSDPILQAILRHK